MAGIHATARIHLVRHGRSSHSHDGRWMHCDEVHAFEDAYDAAGIRDDDTPPPELIRTAESAHVIAASDLPRAIASATRIAPGRDPDVTPLLREFRLEPPRWLPRLPMQAWELICYVQWTYRLLGDAPNDSIRRAEDAAEWLAQRAGDLATVVAVTHGGFRRLIGNRLELRGWRTGPGPRSYANWSVWSYAGDGTQLR